MKQRRLLVAVGLGAVLTTARASSAQTTSAGPYYATPSWDQKLACDTPASCPRFVVLGNWNNDAVLDRETGLVWDRTPLTSCGGLFCTMPDSGTRTYISAVEFCASRVIGGRGGWRLPRFEELLSLLDLDAANLANPRLPPGHPFLGIRPSDYWTTTPDVEATTFQRVVDFSYKPFFGKNIGLTSTNPLAEAFIWCVRGGAGGNAQ